MRPLVRFLDSYFLDVPNVVVQNNATFSMGLAQGRNPSCNMQGSSSEQVGKAKKRNGSVSHRCRDSRMYVVAFREIQYLTISSVPATLQDSESVGKAKGSAVSATSPPPPPVSNDKASKPVAKAPDQCEDVDPQARECSDSDSEPETGKQSR
jgi:hypothetical protein